MINLSIPGFKDLNIRHIVLDYNGTLAFDGKLINGVKEKLIKLNQLVDIHILTADTFGTVKDEFNDFNINIVIIEKNANGTDFKVDFINKLGFENCLCIGNGNNDAKMLKESSIGIITINKEGASINTLLNSDVIVTNILDAFDLILNPKRLIATLRK